MVTRSVHERCVTDPVRGSFSRASKRYEMHARIASTRESCHMLKKAGAVAAAAAGLVMLGAPAMAYAETPRGGEPNNQIGFINVNDVNFLNSLCALPWQWNGSVIGGGDGLTVGHSAPYTACTGNTDNEE